MEEGQADLGLDVFQLELHLTTQLKIEGAEGLIEKQQSRAIHDSAGQRNTLLLATGELRGFSGGNVSELHQSQGIARQLLGIGNFATPQAKHDVFENRHMGE